MTTIRPDTATPPLTWRRHLHALAAGIALLALVAGVPLLLAAAVGNPLPDHLPTLAEAHRALTRPLSDTAVVRVLAGCAWLAWAHLLVSVVTETVSQLRGLPAPRPLPLLGVNQALAHRLVATVLLVVPAAASTTAPVAALTRAPGVPYPASASTAVAMTVAEVPSSPGTGPANGTACTVTSPPVEAAPAAPRAPHKVYVVQPPHGRHYDSLWDIAARHLGDGRRYHEIYQLNRGRPQPDGGELTRASLIQPGWVLLLPADATGPGVLDETTPVPPGPTAHQDQVPVPAGDGPVASQPSAAPIAPPKPRVPAGSTAPRGASSASSSAPAPPVIRSAPDTEHHRPPVAPIAVGLGVGSLAALAALRRARRIAQRRRPLGMRPAPVPDELRPVEAGLHAEARHAEPVTDAVRLAVALAVQRQHDLPIRAVVRHDGGDIDLLLDDPPTVPAPFHPIDGGWRLPAAAAGFAFAVDGRGDPAPALLQLGRTGDADVYIDLEPLGVVAIDGDEDAVDDLIATTVSRLVGAPWAGLVHVMTPDHVARRTGPLDHLEVVPDLAARAADLAAHARRAGLERDLAGHGSNGTAGHGDADPSPLLVLAGWRVGELPAALLRAAADAAVPMLAILTGSLPDAHQWHLAGGQLTGDRMPVPVSVPDRPAAADQVPLLIEHTRTADAVPRDDPAYIDLRADAPAADEAAEPVPMSVNVLGPVELQGIDMPRRTPAFQTLVYLALHRRGATAEQLATALWPDELAAGKTVRNRVAEARAVADGAISDGPGWQLEERVGCDWRRFQALAGGSFDERLQALELVRGQPFDGFTDEWVDSQMLRTDIIAAVIDLAVDVAEQALADDQPAVAFRAARAGLRASPYEERLFRIAMRAADAEGSTGKLRALMDELRKALDVHVQPDDDMQRETLLLYEELMSSARRRARV